MLLPLSLASAFATLRDLEREGMTLSSDAHHYRSALQR